MFSSPQQLFSIHQLSISRSYLLIFIYFQKIGETWITNLDELRGLEKYQNDKNFLLSLHKVKQVGETYNIQNQCIYHINDEDETDKK